MSTPNKSFNTPAHNSFIDSWDVPVNANWNSIDNAFGGLTSLNVTSQSGTISLTLDDYTPPIIEISGTLTANVIYQLPASVGGFWIVSNATTGAFTVTWSSATGGGSTAVIPQDSTAFIFCDGTNVSYGDTLTSGAGGSNTQVQFNNAGALGGSADLTWNGTTLALKGVLNIVGATSGAFGLQVPAAAGAITYTLPAADGSPGQFLTTNGAATLQWTGATGGVTSFSAGTTGLTPSASTGGAIILGGTLALANGGTGATTAAGAQTNLNVPSRTGAGASGTWPIAAASISPGSTIALTGDVLYTSPTFTGAAPVTAAATLATVNSNVGTFGSASNVARVTVNAKGLVTAASNVPIGLQYAQFRNQQASGTGNAETLTLSTWTQRTLNTTVSNTITGASLSGNQVILPAGAYMVSASAGALSVGGAGECYHQIRLYNATGATPLLDGVYGGPNTSGGQTVAVTAALSGVIVLSGSTSVEIDSFTGNNAGHSFSGGLASSSGDPEVYVDVTFLKIG